MRLLGVLLVTLATVHCASCIFPLFFPGPIIYPKTTPAPTTEAPAPPPPPPPPQKIVHVYKPSHSYSKPKHHYAPQKSHHYAPQKSHHYTPHKYYHHYIEYDEGYPAEEYSSEEVTEPPTTTTTTTTTTPEPTTKKHHYYRLVYPQPPPLYYPHHSYYHHSGGHYGAPPAPPPHYYGHYKPAVARKAPVKVAVAEPVEESAPPMHYYKKPTTPPPSPMDDANSAESSEMKVMPMKTAYKPKYEAAAPRRRPPPAGYPYPDQYQNPKFRRPPPVYQGAAPQRRPSPNIPMRSYRPVPNPPPVYETKEMEMVQKEIVEPVTPKAPTVPPKTRRPAVYYVTPTSTASPPYAPPESYSENPPIPYSENPPVPYSESPPVQSRFYMPPPDDYDQDASFGPSLFNVSSPDLMNINRRVDMQHRRVLNPPARLDGHNYEFWNRRDSIVNPQLEQPSFDTLSYNFIREMIANSTMSSIAQKRG